MPLVLARNLWKRTILKGLSLTVKRGETVAIMGPSGSGKSTLLGLLGGLDAPDEGIIEVAGLPISDLPEAQLSRWRRTQLGFVFQAYHLIRALTVIENVALPLYLAGQRAPEARAKALLQKVGLGQRLHHYPAQLSGGEQQRVAVARAFVAAPPLILADEPTGNLDSKTGAAVIDVMLEQTRQHGSTLILVTHDPELAARLDRTLHLKDGAFQAPAPIEAQSHAAL